MISAMQEFGGELARLKSEAGYILRLLDQLDSVSQRNVNLNGAQSGVVHQATIRYSQEVKAAIERAADSAQEWLGFIDPTLHEYSNANKHE